jgi:hypothetical protein
MSPRAAAELLRLDYRDPGKLDTVSSIDIAGVQARIVGYSDYGWNRFVLLITGTNARSDWHMANFRWWPLPHVMEGDTRRWHRGFWRHAAVCYSFAKGWREAGGAIDFVAGHSLGAAAAQIVGSSLRIQTLCFASPKPLYGDGGQPPGHEHVTSWCDRSDWVCRAPPSPRFHHVGRVIWFNSEASLKDRVQFRSHPIERYLEADLRMP